MLACNLKKQFLSVIKKTKIGFHVVNFNGKKKLCRLCFKKAFVELVSFIPIFSYILSFVNSQYQPKENFVGDINGK